MKCNSILFICVSPKCYVFAVFFFWFWAFSMRFLCLNSRWFLAFRAFWQSGLSQYSCRPFLLNETARSYKVLSQEANTIDGFTFVWFTDGIGWKSARGNLRESFEAMDMIYSIDDMENGVMEKAFV